MTSVVIKRIVIIVSLILTLFVSQAVSQDNLLFYLPNDELIAEAQQYLYQTDQEVSSIRDDFIRNQLSPAYRALIEQQEEALTLENRDGLRDFEILFDHTVDHTFTIHFSSDAWNQFNQNMYDYYDIYGNYRTNEYESVDVTYVADGETIEIQEVGIRSKGNIFSRKPPLTPTNDIRPIHYVLKFNETFDYESDSDYYDLLKTREVFNLEKLIFKFNNQQDKSYINEVYSYELFEQAGVPLPNITMTRFIIEVEGVEVMRELYSVQEFMDEEFIRRRLQETPKDEVGDLYKVVWPGDLRPIVDTSKIGVRTWETNTIPTYGKETNQDDLTHEELRLFTQEIASNDPAKRREFLEEYLTINQFISATAVSLLTGNPDDYRTNYNNYYLYFDESGRATYIPYDYDNSMGAGWAGPEGSHPYTLGNDIYTWREGFEAPLTDAVLSYEDYQKAYESVLLTYIETIYTPEAFNEFFLIFDELYGDEFVMINDKTEFILQKIDDVKSGLVHYQTD